VANPTWHLPKANGPFEPPPWTEYNARSQTVVDQWYSPSFILGNLL